MSRPLALLLGLSALFVGGCSLFGGDSDDPTEPPAE